MKRACEELKEWLIILGLSVGGIILAFILMIIILAFIACFACVSFSPFILIAYILSNGNSEIFNNFIILILGIIIGICTKVKIKKR